MNFGQISTPNWMTDSSLLHRYLKLIHVQILLKHNRNSINTVMKMWNINITLAKNKVGTLPLVDLQFSHILSARWWYLNKYWIEFISKISEHHPTFVIPCLFINIFPNPMVFVNCYFLHNRLLVWLIDLELISSCALYHFSNLNSYYWTPGTEPSQHYTKP